MLGLGCCSRNGGLKLQADSRLLMADSYFNIIACSPSCSFIRRLTSFFSPSLDFVSTKSLAAGDQSSLKLVESAEIQICRTGELGEMTNLLGGSSKLICSAPELSSTSKSASPSASYKLRFR